MRITHILTLGGIALLVAGCEDTGRQARYATGSSYGGQVISSSPSPGTTSYPSGGTTSYPSAAYPAPAPATPSYSPPGMTEADLSLANAVRQQLNRYGDLITAMSTLQISAQNGTVTLAGPVQSQRERDMIDALTKNTPGVLGVNDQMQVSAAPSAAYSQSDQALANQLEQALYNTPTVAPFAPNIRINVQNGKVILTGNVPSEQDRQSVDNVVRNTPGVVSVVDQLGISTVPTGRVAETSRVYRPDAGQMFNLHVQGLTETDRATYEWQLPVTGFGEAGQGKLKAASVLISRSVS